jgi:hypothetical protein
MTDRRVADGATLARVVTFTNSREEDARVGGG